MDTLKHAFWFMIVMGTLSLLLSLSKANGRDQVLYECATDLECEVVEDIIERIN